MSVFSPQPRFRIYSRTRDYFQAMPALATGAYAAGDHCETLEKALTEHLGVPYAVGMPQARVGLHLAIKASVPQGGEVILSPNTIADVINMIISAGAVPIFCDINPVTGNIDPDLIEPLISSKTVAILATHLYGLVAPMDRLREISTRHNLILMEDAAQAFGAKFEGGYAGALGDVGVFSFGMAKNIMAFFGGMVLTSDKKIADRVRQEITSYPIISRKKLGKKVLSCLIKDLMSSDIFFPHLLFKIFRHGYRKNIKSITRLIETELDLYLKESLPEDYKSQFSALQAKLVLEKLESVDLDFQHRLSCAKMYHDGLSDIHEIRLPPMLEDGSHVYNYYPIGYKNRHELRLFMMNQNRDIALQHIKNTADLPAFERWHQDCPNCRKWANETIMLPNYGKYRLSEVEKNISSIRAFFKK